MLIFTSISVNKNNSFYNSKRQKKSSNRTNINRTNVYVCKKQSMLMFTCISYIYIVVADSNSPGLALLGQGDKGQSYDLVRNIVRPSL